MYFNFLTAMANFEKLNFNKIVSHFNLSLRFDLVILNPPLVYRSLIPPLVYQSLNSSLSYQSLNPPIVYQSLNPNVLLKSCA